MRILGIYAVCVLAVSSSCATGTEAPVDRSLLADDGGEAGSIGGGTSGIGGTSEVSGGASGLAGAGARSGNGGGAFGGAAGVGVGGVGGSSGRGAGGAGGSSSLGGGGAAGSNVSGAGAGGKLGAAGSNSGGGGSAGTGGSPATAPPKGLSVDTAKDATAQHTGTNGGISRDDACPQGQVLIGFNGTVGTDATYLRSVSGVCATLAMGSQAPYAITTSQAGALPVREAAKSMAQTALCPANQVVVGFQGRSGSFIDALWFKCAPLSVGAAPGYALVIGTTTDTALIGGQSGGSPFSGILCGANEVAVSQQPIGGSGNVVNSFGVACSTISVIK